MAVDYADLGDYESKEYRDWRYYVDKFITTPQEYKNYQENLEELKQENQYLKEQNVENSVDIPTPQITGDKTIDLIIMIVAVIFVIKSL